MYALTFFYSSNPEEGATYLVPTYENAYNEMEATYNEFIKLISEAKIKIFESHINDYEFLIIVEDEFGHLEKAEAYITKICE